MTTKWECKNCQCFFVEDDITPVLVYTDGNREEPDEYEGHCPDCHSTNIVEIPMQFCVSCEDVIVRNEGEMCGECMTCQAEAKGDEARGH